MTGNLIYHHVGIGVLELEPAIDSLLDLDHRTLVKVVDTELKAEIAILLNIPSGQIIELVAPFGENNPLKSLIERKCIPGPYHICYRVDVLVPAIERLKNSGMTLIVQPTPAIAFAGAQVCFFYSSKIGLVELVETSSHLPEQQRVNEH